VSVLRPPSVNPANVGGAGIASTFMKLDLIDEFRLYVHPVIRGAGKPMFYPLDRKINLRLVETKTFIPVSYSSATNA